MSCCALELTLLYAKISNPRDRNRVNSEPWDEGEGEEIVSLLMLGVREPIITEDPSSTVEDIFGDLHLQDHQRGYQGGESWTRGDRGGGSCHRQRLRRGRVA